MQRNRAYYRWHRFRVIYKKVKFLQRRDGIEGVESWTRGQYGRLSKGKIHCSCWMCRFKSYDNLTHADLKQLVSARQQMLLYMSEQNNPSI